MKKKVHKLSINLDFDFVLIGISSHENDYKLSWEINNKTHIKLSKSSDLEIIDTKRSETLRFSLFSSDNHENFDTIYLISNKCYNGYFIEELKNIDYFIQIFDVNNNTFTNTFITALKEIQCIHSCFIIDPNTLKEKEKLLF